MQLCDAYMGVPSVLVDDDTRRAELYGKAGAFRPTSYGAEYRVLSNWWLKSPNWVRWVYDSGKAAFDKLVSENMGDWLDAEKDRICTIINTRNQEEARRFINDYPFVKECYAA